MPLSFSTLSVTSFLLNHTSFTTLSLVAKSSTSNHILASEMESSQSGYYYRTNPERLPLLGHVSFGVKSYEASKAFYTAALTALGINLVFNSPDEGVLGYGYDDKEIVNIFETPRASAPGGRCHLAFNAPDRKAVRGFYDAAVANGGKDNGKPGVRTEVGDRYYAAFVVDPDGYRLEAVFQQESDEVEEEGKNVKVDEAKIVNI